ncbi:MAG: 3-deoxy-7-phosphoheptulonate synthase [Endomicrobiaceae bacterium]|jgi:3-deoxy-7-phosphoheptulonate synthase|nr:3-deoxy-7-phosphoheptulonate synthase [Endomicrobiaceae bacterium]MDD3729633.1 3-deoxy-7-phosphoheptulonate synthase [Endomicrobiaceae bacterium]MDD4165867.1 3-deoxy-7-phosphoheptulonate synthase [Endomicrobiaceae bacterium]
MIITLRHKATKQDEKKVVEKIKKLGYLPHISRGVDITIIGMIGEFAEKYKENFEAMDEVDHISEIEKPYKLASRQFKKENTVIKLPYGVEIGGKEVHIMGGPCAIESKNVLFEIGKIVKNAGGTILRGGAFKPRSSPYTFQGLGLKGLKYIQEAGKKLKMPTISEAMSVEQVPLVSKYCDIVQIGARNIQNYDLLKACGKQKKPVLLKRGMATTVKELLLSAEYILSQGNYNVMLCERGIRTFEDSTRFTLDLNAVPVLKKLTHLPIVLDPSHGIGIREHVPTMAKACIAVGADALVLEIHPRPEEALSDGPQSLLPDQYSKLMSELKVLAKAVEREI